MSELFDLWGLAVSSSHDLSRWALPSCRAEADLQLSLGAESWVELEEPVLRFRRDVGDSGILEIYGVGEDWWWIYPDESEFWIRGDGGEVRGRWPAHYSPEDALTYLVGPILGFVLRLRGITSLHAASVVVDDRALVFVGGATAGKSTLSAEFIRRGYALLSDDVTALDRTSNGRFLALPSVPVVKLWHDAASRVGDLPAMSPNWPKRLLRVSASELAAAPVEVSAVFVLGMEQERIGPAEALAALMQNVYVSYAAGHEGRARDLELLAAFVETCPISGLPRAPSLDEIGQRVDRALERVR